MAHDTTTHNGRLQYGDDMIRTNVITILQNLKDDLKVDDVTSTEDDYDRATDIKVTADGVTKTVGVRVRNNNDTPYRWVYPNQFTLRASTRSGTHKAEMNKIQDGYMDMMFYGHEVKGEIVEWSILDMDVLRECLVASGSNYYSVGRPRNHGSYDTSFWAFDITKFPSSLVVVSKKDEDK